VLKSLWRRKTATVRDICDDYRAAGRKTAYTSIATFVRIMVTKGYVEIVDARRPQKFRATADQVTVTGQRLLESVADIFDGDVTAAIRTLQAIKPQRKSA
jgi:predicted transcriptional regulator